METEKQRQARIARQKREQAAGLVGLGVIALIIACIFSLPLKGLKSKNAFVRYLSLGFVAAVIGLIVIAVIACVVNN